MKDDEVRAIERDILAAPADLELRRRHALHLLRVDEERGLGALDLAWRLGAEELWGELKARLEGKRFEFRDMSFGYVPGGPFAMGTDEGDADAAPLHLVHLSPFYVSREPVSWLPFEGWRRDRWPLGAEPRSPYLQLPARMRHDELLTAIEWLNDPRHSGPEGRFGLITEAQWERVFRASYLRRDGTSPYGAILGREPEWTADIYSPDAYSPGVLRDPLIAAANPAVRPALWSVRGGTGLPPPAFATYREAANDGGQFNVGGRFFARWVGIEEGILARVVFVPGPRA